MAHYAYLIVGGGMTGDAAIKGIRERDAHGTIGLIGAEPDPPYNRPPLSKGLWKGKSVDSIWRKTPAQGITLHLGRTARALDPNARQVTDDQGTVYTFDRLLLATGGTPRRLPGSADRVIYYRTVADYRRLREWTERGRRFAVIGGGFIGWEIAAALAMNDRGVVMLFPQDGIGARAYPSDLSEFLNRFYTEKGVEVFAGETAADVRASGDQTTVATKSGRTFTVDGIVAGLGITPNTALAEAAGLTIDNGVVVDASLRTSHPDIYAAGDVASFFSTTLGRRMRVEHEDNANTMGRAAGRTMAGDAALHEYVPFFYSDLFDLGYEAVGDVDARLETVADWKEPYREGVVYYLGDGRVRGVLLWNVWEQVEAARALIAEPGPHHLQDLKGRLPRKG